MASQPDACVQPEPASQRSADPVSSITLNGSAVEKATMRTFSVCCPSSAESTHPKIRKPTRRSSYIYRAIVLYAKSNTF